MAPYFPKQISGRAIATYFLSLVVISVMFYGYAMKFGYMVLGSICVLGFFLLTNYWSKNWANHQEKRVISNIFWIALSLRVFWVIFSYFSYVSLTGRPFEFGAADSLGYHSEAEWLSKETWPFIMDYYFGPGTYGISDVGYPLYLTALYKIVGPNLIIPRLIKAVISAFTCVLIYKLSDRTFGHDVARIAAIMCTLMPNLIIYCGYHLKETEMIFLEVAFLERMDYLLRARKWNFVNILIPILLAGSLFFLRTVLGAAGVFAFATSVLVINTPSMRKGWKRATIIIWGLLAVFFLSGGTLMTEVESLWEERDSNASNRRLEQTLRGNQWAKYATGGVMAPMAFVLPFSTMIEVDQQYGQNEKHGGNFIRNFMGIFALLGIYEAFRRKKWRDFALIGSFVIGYLGVVSMSGFSNSERFLLPGLPGLIMMWAYGIASLRERTWKIITPWCVVVFVIEFAWAYFKLGSRGLF